MQVMVTLEQHIIELQAEISACPDTIERMKIEAELIAARFQQQRIAASAQAHLQRARRAPPDGTYHPRLGMVSHHPRCFARTHPPLWNAGQLAAKLEEIALELHLAHGDPARAKTHLAIALGHLDDMQRDLLC
jgi:hypothetical protein